MPEIQKDGSAVVSVFAGGYAHHVSRSMAMGCVVSDHSAPGTLLQVEIPGEFQDAKVPRAPIYGANGANMWT